MITQISKAILRVPILKTIQPFSHYLDKSNFVQGKL
jgi:hypothetical protein